MGGRQISRRRTSAAEATEPPRELSEGLLDSLFENSPVGVYVAQRGLFKYVNKDFQSVTGFGRDELMEADSLSLVVPEDRQGVRDSAVKMLKGERSVPYEFRVVDKSGQTRWVIGTLAPSRYRGARAAVGYYMDITEQKRAEEELERSNKELEQFAHAVAHDLQEPLRMVASYTQLLAQRYTAKLDEDADEFIAYIVDGAKRMRDLIEGLLAYSRVGSGEMPFQLTDCEDVLDVALANLEAAIAESGARISRETLPTVMGDGRQLRQVFQNLISNSIKFRRPERPEVRIGAERNDREWLFHVTDNGIGVDPKYAGRVFDIFQRLHSSGEYPGTGIGLAICQRSISRQGGRIWMESAQGQGSTVYFTVPMHQGGGPQ